MTDTCKTSGGDPELLAAANEGLIRFVLNRWFVSLARRGRLDVWDYGRHVLRLAAERYNPSRGEFTTYATIRLQLEMRAFRRRMRQRRRGDRRYMRMASRPQRDWDAVIDIRTAVDALPADSRRVWDTYAATGFDASETARLVGVRRTAGRLLVERAKQFLREKLGIYANS